ncbi:hypothetical protein SG34_021200 [Thalassomonas viridans]|uniref:Uncharacterized protein n=1 Tax=Thalassomonas viridans TaxID=137584 RepID=A0AAF0C7N1_9GAMM|nr:hypothetical protein [Thalassomonas viridans]WDE03868.1 hypothetical protein SG34_021200 [Thalassomonas viridans]
MSKNNFLASRAWLLMLLEGAERNGITPVNMEQLHRYIYLANVLSPVCMLTMPESYTLKHMRGPYFPRAQWDIGRLTTQGFVDSTNFKPFSDEDGFWLSADYRIADNGISLIEKLNAYDHLAKQANYLREFMSACSDIAAEKINLVTQNDFHYSSVPEGAGVNFSETDGNLSRKAVILMFPEDRVYSPTEGVHRYIDYLAEVSNH